MSPGSDGSRSALHRDLSWRGRDFRRCSRVGIVGLAAIVAVGTGACTADPPFSDAEVEPRDATGAAGDADDARNGGDVGAVAAEDGVELFVFRPPGRLRSEAPADCATALRVDGACVPFRGVFGDDALTLDDRAPVATAFSTRFGAPFERRLQVLFRTEPTARPSERPTASLLFEIVLGGDTVGTGQTFTCAEANPVAIDPANVVDADRLVLHKDLHALQAVFHPPSGGGGGALASNFAPGSACTVRFDEFPDALLTALASPTSTPRGAKGRLRGSLDAVFEDRNGATIALTDGLFDVVLHVP